MHAILLTQLAPPCGLAPFPPVSAAQFPPSSGQPQFTLKIPAGFPSPAADYVEDELDLNTYLIKHRAASFFFQVEGDSMIGAGIFDGDKVLVDRSLVPMHGHVVVAIIDAEFTLKRLYRVGDTIELRPENPAYRAIPIREGNDLQIWGVVSAVIRKLRT